MYLNFVLQVMITWARGIKLTFIFVAARATETWWAEARCIWLAASLGTSAYIEVVYIEVRDLCPRLKAF